MCVFYNYMAVDNSNDFMADVCGLSGALNRDTSLSVSHRATREFHIYFDYRQSGGNSSRDFIR